jgi:4a-hydroxytetrahydrobiopterin dehydratase
MRHLLTDDEVTTALADLPGWRYEERALRRTLEAADFATAIGILDAVAVVAEEMDHHPDVDLRYRTLGFGLWTHSASGVTELDVELAHRVSAIAAEHGVHVDDALDHAPELGIGIDCSDPKALIRWWASALRYVERDGVLHDPAGRGPFVWFQPVPEPKAGKNRIHLDLLLPRHEAAAKRDLLVALGGRVLAEHETFWVLADPDGNEVCVCVAE